MKDKERRLLLLIAKNRYCNALCKWLLCAATLVACFPIFEGLDVRSTTSFSRQEIVDPEDDWTLVGVTPGAFFKVMTQNGTSELLRYEDNVAECRRTRYLDSLQHHFHPPDISSVSYSSNGSILDLTLWLSSPFRHPPSNASEWMSPGVRGSPWYSIGYLVSVGVHTAYDVEGPDYGLAYTWDVINGTWSRQIVEVSPKGDTKYLDYMDNYSIFDENNDIESRTHISFSMNLAQLSHPEHYSLVFSVNDYFIHDGRVCAMSDITSRVHVPPPSFDLTALPSSIELRPGEEKNVRLQLSSNSNIQGQVHFNLDESDTLSRNIISELSSDEINIAPYGIVTSNLNIKSLSNASIGSYTLPIVADLDIPTIATTRRSSEFITNTLSENLNTTSYFTITLLPPLSFEQTLDIFFKEWVLPLTGIWTFLAGIGAVIVPLLIRLYRKNKKK